MSRPNSITWPLTLALVGLTQIGSSADVPPTVDLSTFYKMGSVVEDRNGDSFADFATARIVMGSPATPGDIVAAANIAARLGLETTAMNIPVSRDVSGPGTGIVVGSGGAKAASLAAADSMTDDLGQGEGRVHFRAGAAPAVFVGGKTDDGTMAAAEYLAARLPYAWDVKGATLEKVGADLKDALKPSGVVVTSLAINDVIVTRQGVRRIVADIKLGTGADLAKARAALTQIAARVPKAETPAMLSYRGVEVLRVTLASGAATAGPGIDIKTAAKAERPQPIARRASGAKEGLDLSTIYSIDGGLGDSDNNL
ncbi:MAG: hypothetical protein ABIR28_08940, partial [Vicinamibacteria bacterium]